MPHIFFERLEQRRSTQSMVPYGLQGFTQGGGSSRGQYSGNLYMGPIGPGQGPIIISILPPIYPIVAPDHFILDGDNIYNKPLNGYLRSEPPALPTQFGWPGWGNIVSVSNPWANIKAAFTSTGSIFGMPGSWGGMANFNYPYSNPWTNLTAVFPSPSSSASGITGSLRSMVNFNYPYSNPWTKPPIIYTIFPTY